MISANGVEYKNLPEQVQYLTERAAEFAVELNRVSASVESVAGDVAALQTSYTALAEDVRVAKININSLFTNVGTAFSEIANIKNGTTPLFETITDSHGNKRFVEGDLTLGSEFANLGITKKYGKWSLSGTHLMIVLVADIPSGVTTPVNASFCELNIPAFIYNKLSGLWGDTLDVKNISVRSTTTWYSGVKMLDSVICYKIQNNKIRISTSGSTVTCDVESTCRIQFDFIIDAS